MHVVKHLIFTDNAIAYDIKCGSPDDEFQEYILNVVALFAFCRAYCIGIENIEKRANLVLSMDL